MKVAETRIGVPMLQIATKVHHATPRKPTAFERVVLSMISQLRDNAAYNNIPLETICAEILGIRDPAPLITPTLLELSALDIIRCAGDLDALDLLALRDMSITERGQRMIAEDMLPAKSMQNSEDFFFDPLNERLLSRSQSKIYRPKPPEYSIDSNDFEHIFPETLIRSHISPKHYKWFNESSEIERIEPQSTETLWKDTSCSVELHKGTIQVVTKEPSLKSYLSKLDPDIYFSRFITPLFDHRNPSEDAPDLRFDELERGSFSILPVSAVLNEWPQKARVAIPSMRTGLSSMPDSAPKSQAIVLFQEALEHGFKVEWNEEKNGCIIHIKAPHPDPFVIRVTDVDQIQYNKVEVICGGEPRSILVACQRPCSADHPLLNAVCAYLSPIIESATEADDQYAALYWESEQSFREKQIQRLLKLDLSLDQLISEYFGIMSRVKEINQRIDKSIWHEALLEILSEKISHLKALDVNICKSVLSALAKDWNSLGDNTHQFLSAIIEKLAPPTDLTELAEITSIIRIVDQKWSPSYPSKFFDTQMLKDMLEQFPHRLSSEEISYSNALCSSLTGLLELHQSIKKIVGSLRLDTIHSDDDYIELIKTTNCDRLIELIHDWSVERDYLQNTLGDSVSLIGTRILEIDAGIGEISGWLKKLEGAINPQIRGVYVFDTSALIANPLVAQRVDSSEMVVVSKRVIEELDDKKLNEDLRPKVGQAVRNLKDLPKENVTFCEGDLSLLSSDYRDKSDNLILSVAVRYRRHKPTLVTNDNNLSLKAIAEGFRAMTADQFMNRPRPAQSRNKNVKKPRRHKKNGKQGSSK